MSRRVLTLIGHTHELRTACIKPDGRLIASGGFDGLRIWDAAHGRQQGPVLFEGELCLFASWTPDGSQLVLAFFQPNPNNQAECKGLIRILDGSPPFTTRREHFFSEAVYSIALSQDGRLAVCATSRGARMWLIGADDNYTMEQLGKMRFTCSLGIPMDALPIGRELGASLFVLGCWGAKVFVCAVREGHIQESPQYLKLYEGEANAGPMRGDVNCVAISPDWRCLLTGHRDGELLKWNWQESGAPQCRMQHEDGVTACAWSPDGKFIGAGAADGSVAYWDAASEELFEMWDHGTYVTACAWDSKQRFFITASNDNRIILWEPPR